MKVLKCQGMDLILLNDVFGTQEIREREIAKRESEKRDDFSRVWSIREIAKRDYISWGRTYFLFLLTSAKKVE